MELGYKKFEFDCKNLYWVAGDLAFEAIGKQACAFGIEAFGVLPYFEGGGRVMI